MARGRAAHRQIADQGLVHLDGELVLERLGVEARSLGEGGIDQRLRHAVADDEVEADLLEGAAQLGAEPLQRAGLAGEIGREVENRNLLRGVGTNRRQAWRERLHGTFLLFPY